MASLADEGRRGPPSPRLTLLLGYLKGRGRDWLTVDHPASLLTDHIILLCPHHYCSLQYMYISILNFQTKQKCGPTNHDRVTNPSVSPFSSYDSPRFPLQFQPPSFWVFAERRCHRINLNFYSRLLPYFNSL